MSPPRLDIKDLAVRESEQVEWKENVAEVEPWDLQPCQRATVADIDLLALRDALQRMDLYSEQAGVQPYLSDTRAFSPCLPPLLVREPRTFTLRPRNFAMLLFGRRAQRFIPGAISSFSAYQGCDRGLPFGESIEQDGPLLRQAEVLLGFVEAQASTLYDKEDLKRPSVAKYSKRALREALANAFVHRDYQLNDPLRVTAFLDRVEFHSPGGLPFGVRLEDIRRGLARPARRNQTLAFFFNKLELAEGQGLRTIRETMRREGCPPPLFEANEIRVLCILRAHPRALERSAAGDPA